MSGKQGLHLKARPEEGFRGGGPGRPKGSLDKKPRRKKRRRPLATKIIEQIVVVEKIKEIKPPTEREINRELIKQFKALPPPIGDELLPKNEIHIAKCCATCKHYMSIAAATNYHRGFCKLDHNDAVRSGIRMKYDSNYVRIGSLTEEIPRLAKHYPVVHEYFVCDEYHKTSSWIRLRILLKFLKKLQDKIIWESDLEI